MLLQLTLHPLNLLPEEPVVSSLLLLKLLVSEGQPLNYFLHVFLRPQVKLFTLLQIQVFLLQFHDEVIHCLVSLILCARVVGEAIFQHSILDMELFHLLLQKHDIMGELDSAKVNHQVGLGLRYVALALWDADTRATGLCFGFCDGLIDEELVGSAADSLDI